MRSSHLVSLLNFLREFALFIDSLYPDSPLNNLSMNSIEQGYDLESLEFSFGVSVKLFKGVRASNTLQFSVS